MSKVLFRVDKGLTFKPLDKSSVVNPQVNDIVNDSVTGELVKYNGVSWEELGGSGGFGDLDVFAQVTNVNTEASDFVTTGSANATLTKDTHPFMGEAFKLTITSATGADLFSTRRGIDYAVPEEFRGQSVQLTYDYISDVAKGSICFEVTNLFDASTIVYTTELQAQPDATGIVTKGFIFFTIPQTASTIRIAMKRPSGAPDITSKTFWFNNVELRKYQMLINPIRPAVGTIQEFAGPIANIPYGFLNCDGAAVSRSTYAKLFAVIGTTYGTGDGSTTFNLPNTQGIALRGVGSQTYGGVTYSATLGQKRNDAIQNITGTFAAEGNHATGAFYNIGTAVSGSGGGTGTDPQKGFDASLVARTDTQTHGADLAVNYMICFDDGPARYADYTLNQDVYGGMFNNTSTTQATTTTYAKLTTFNTALPGVGVTVDLANDELVVQTGGDFEFNLGVSNSSITQPIEAIINVNGIDIAPHEFSGVTISGSGVLRGLKVGDKISVLVRSGTAGANVGAWMITKFTIHKLATSQQLFAPIGPVTFRAGNSSGQSVPSNTTTTITGWTLLDDTTNGAFNASTGIFTAPEDGFYAFGFTYTLNSQTFAVRDTYDAIISSSIGKSVVMTNVTSVANPVWVSPSVTNALFLPKGATVRPQVYFGSTGNKTLNTNPQRTIFYGYKVR